MASLSYHLLKFGTSVEQIRHVLQLVGKHILWQVENIVQEAMYAAVQNLTTEQHDLSRHLEVT